MQLQYQEMKSKHKDTILLFRLGDFYEAFNEDAEKISKVLNITLTGRGKGEERTPMAGIPYHALDNYLPKLVEAGLKVAIAEQLTEPGQGKIVERGITKIVTAGTYADSKNLDESQNQNIVCIHSIEKGNSRLYFLASLDITTGKFHVQLFEKYIDLFNEIQKLKPLEILLPEKFKRIDLNLKNFRLEYTYDSDFEFSRNFELLTTHFHTLNLKGFGFEDNDECLIPAGVLLRYAKENLKTDLVHIQTIKKVSLGKTMKLDFATIMNLELVSPMRNDAKSNTLFDVLNKCATAMGKRMLRSWILNPLTDIDLVNSRLNIVETFCDSSDLREKISESLSKILDIERLIGKIGTGNVNGRDLIGLSISLQNVRSINNLLESIGAKYLDAFKPILDPSNYDEIIKVVESAINPECPVRFDNGGVIKSGYSEEIDSLRNLSTNGKDYILNIQTRERERSGISSLKIKYNKVFGYYIEISKSNLNKVPDDFIRKQTVVNAERFITPELKEYEEKVLSAEEKLIGLEMKIFAEVVECVKKYILQLQKVSDAISNIDVYVNFANVAVENKYVKPKILNFAQGTKISNGRHPVVELIKKEQYIANDVELNEKDNFVILTGPNMSGKSTYIRQIALINLMAQVGSYVPASFAEIAITDRIFTRVGASDNLAQGESTFMVEMNETANILNNATEKSLIILDEVGRGTSTYDGVAIAWSIVEYIHNKIGAKTLFATHYHELIKLEDKLKNVKNFHVVVNERNGEVVFTHHIEKGGMDKSYGVHVAEMAGVPKEVTTRAAEILQKFEQTQSSGSAKVAVQKKKEINPENLQMGLI